MGEVQQQTGWGNDTLSGFEKMVGSRFGDTLSGSDDRDTIDGGAGNDRIEGGGKVRVHSLDDLMRLDQFQPNTVDQILDFSHADEDRILLNILDADPDTAGQKHFASAAKITVRQACPKLRSSVSKTKAMSWWCWT